MKDDKMKDDKMKNQWAEKRLKEIERDNPCLSGVTEGKILKPRTLKEVTNNIESKRILAQFLQPDDKISPNYERAGSHTAGKAKDIVKKLKTKEQLEIALQYALMHMAGYKKDAEVWDKTLLQGRKTISELKEENRRLLNEQAIKINHTHTSEDIEEVSEIECPKCRAELVLGAMFYVRQGVIGDDERS